MRAFVTLLRGLAPASFLRANAVLRGASTRLVLACVLFLISICIGGCGAHSTQTTSTAAAGTIPTWERPGLGGAVRPEMGSPQPGEVAPELALLDVDGRSQTLSSFRGNSWVVLHFTATWCPFCDAEVEHLSALSDAFADRGVKTVIVNVEEELPTWRAYAMKHVRPSVLALHDPNGVATARFAPLHAQESFDDRAQAVLDGTLILDPHGVIRLFLLPDSAHFDPTFRAVRAELERLVPPAIVSIVRTEEASSLITAKPGEERDVAITLRVADGYHIMSNRPSKPTYIPTRIVATPAAPTTPTTPATAIGVDVRYPEASVFDLSSSRIATFQGEIVVHVKLRVPADAPPGTKQRIEGVLHYQACTTSRCLFPAKRDFTIAVVDVVGP